MVSTQVVSVGSYKQSSGTPRIPWWQREPNQEVSRRKKIQRLQHGLLTSSIALGVATIGTCSYIPLKYASAPLLVYMGIPPAQDAGHALIDEGRISRELYETVLLVVCLVQGYYFVGALGFWLYYVSRYVTDNTHPAEWLSLQLRSLQTKEDEIEVRNDVVQIGDTIVVQHGEYIPVDGVITEGLALLTQSTVQKDPYGILKRVGAEVYTNELVLVGRICVQAR